MIKKTKVLLETYKQQSLLDLSLEKNQYLLLTRLSLVSYFLALGVIGYLAYYEFVTCPYKIALYLTLSHFLLLGYFLLKGQLDVINRALELKNKEERD